MFFLFSLFSVDVSFLPTNLLRSSKVAEAVTTPTYIYAMLGSNPSRDTEHSEIFPFFLSPYRERPE
jgi:hypothetical protein